MRERQLILSIFICSLFIVAGCAKRIPLNYNQAQPDAIVKIKTLSGETLSGEVQKNESAFLVLKQNKNKENLTKINRNEIAEISAKDLIDDGNGKVISEWDIQDQQGNSNFLLYTVGGAGLSFGASFFIGSLIHRSMDDTDKGNKFMWTTTAVGTALGTYLFARSGCKRDRMSAIEEIREQRYLAARQQIESEKLKRKSVQQKLDKERAEREKQEEELKRLKEKIEIDKKKK